MILTIFTDGGSLNNPGPSASAYVISQNGKVIAQEGRFIGHATNKQAEYQALIFAFEKVLELTKSNSVAYKSIAVTANPQLLVQQLKGLYKVKNTKIREKIAKLRNLEGELAVPITTLIRCALETKPPTPS